MSFYHEPVMLREVLDGLQIIAGKKYIDATVGGGGHGIEILKLGGNLLGIDADCEAIEFTRKKWEVGSGKRDNTKKWKLVQGNFKDIEKIAKENGFGEVEGVLFDLGVSSHQFDTEERGFSYRFNQAPLDMRFDLRDSLTAGDIVNTKKEEELYEIFAKFGEEERSRSIAHVLVRARQIKPIKTSGDLLQIIETVVKGKSALFGSASRIFQALRISVNDELEALKDGLEGARHLIVPGGRIVVISFHSLEDRLVKLTFEKSKPIRPTNEEIQKNIRARSAKLRIAQI